MDLVIAGVAVAAFAATVFVLAGAFGNARRPPPRTVDDPEGDDWLTLGEAARILGAREADLLTLIERDAVPYFVVPKRRASEPSDYRFRRDELERWTVG